MLPVPGDAGYAAKQVLDLYDLSINEGAVPALDADGLHVPGDGPADGTDPPKAERQPGEGVECPVRGLCVEDRSLPFREVLRARRFGEGDGFSTGDCLELVRHTRQQPSGRDDAVALVLGRLAAPLVPAA